MHVENKCPFHADFKCLFETRTALLKFNLSTNQTSHLSQKVRESPTYASLTPANYSQYPGNRVSIKEKPCFPPGIKMCFQ